MPCPFIGINSCIIFNPYNSASAILRAATSVFFPLNIQYTIVGLIAIIKNKKIKAIINIDLYTIRSLRPVPIAYIATINKKKHVKIE